MLPGSYERWFTEICGRPAPVESRSTCDACAMLPGAPDLPPEGPFDAAVRCCTYHPTIAPHFAGGILRDGGAGGAIVRARIAARTGVTPLGILPSPEYAAARERVDPRDAFGHARELLCPFYDDATCVVWRHRGAACAVFHCKFDRGAIGASLWNLVAVAFNVIERALGRWLLQHQRLPAAACDALLREPGDPELYARAWGAWRFREQEYFLEATRLVEPLSWAEVAQLGADEDLARLGAALRGAVERFDDLRLPGRVRRGEGIVVQLGRPGVARLRNATAPLDLLDVPDEVARRLEALGEAPLRDLQLEDALARKLLDWHALLPAG